MIKLRLWKAIEIFNSFNINNYLLPTYSITVLGAGYTAVHQKEMKIIVGGKNSDSSVINQKLNEYKVKSCYRCHGKEKYSVMNESNRRTFLDWVVRESLRPVG